ncbi:MAG: hypothetical protein WDM90_13875 [Ferruginibacter sp.]
MGTIKGGRTELRETTTPANQLLNFHAGYNASVFSAKAQLRANYFFNNRWGVNVGAYYLRHFSAPELFDPALGVSTLYQNIRTDAEVNTIFDTPYRRREPIKSDISSIGFFCWR